MKAPPDDNFNKNDNSDLGSNIDDKIDNQQSNPPEIPNNMLEKSIGVKYYVLFGCEAVVYSFIVISKNYFMSNNKEPNMNNQSSNITYKSNNEVNEEVSVSDKEYTSSSGDENALLITSSSTFDNITVSKTGDSYITSIDGYTSNIDFNGYKLYVNGKAI